MFDFRYHALSLTAVFIALAVGLLLGVAIGDSGLVSSADRKLRASLHRDVNAAKRREQKAQTELADADRFQRDVYPLLVSNQLSGLSIGLVFLGDPAKDVTGDVRDALRDTGGELRSVVTTGTGTGTKIADAGKAAEGTRYADLAAVPEPDLKLVRDFGFRIGAQYVNPGKLLDAEKDTIFDTFNGDVRRLDAVIVVYTPPANEAKGYAKDAREQWDQGFVEGLRKSRVPVVGVEEQNTDPSHIGWYKDRSISSVDDIDETAGHASLVFTLQGKQGAYGRRDGADSLLPDAVSATP